MNKLTEILDRIRSKVDSKMILSLVNIVMGILRTLISANSNEPLDAV